MQTIDPISLSLKDFCNFSGIGETLARQMISDGRLRAVRLGRKKLLVDCESWREYLRKLSADGVAPYEVTRKAVETRKANAAQRQRDVIEEAAAKLTLREVLRDEGLL